MLIASFVFIIPIVANAQTLTRQLQVGSTGSDVSELQTFLAQDPTIYPQGLVTGYFGSLTKAAVSRFQSQNGISMVGRVGPITLAAINSQIALGGGGTIGDAPQITSAGVSNISRSSAVVNWYTNENAKGLVYYSTSPLTLGEHPNSVDVSGSTAMTDTNFRSNQSVTLQNLMPNTTYYYLAYVTDQNGNVSITWPATFTTSF
ncbi:MAG: peptidoglycan-binding protein [bacterium]